MWNKLHTDCSVNVYQLKCAGANKCPRPTREETALYPLPLTPMICSALSQRLRCSGSICLANASLLYDT